ncbi:MAG: sulfatase [Thioalkalivibrio sp.]|nr:sulfatase [Thioalkalivibrio sp.]
MLRLLMTFAVLNVLLLGLEIPRYAGLGPNWIALEALVLAGFFSWMPQGRWKGYLAGVAGGLLTLLTLLALADALARLSLSRSLNLYLDYPLARSVYHLVSGSVSIPGAILAGIALLLALTALALLLRWLLAGLGNQRGALPRAVAAAFILVGAGGIASFHAGAGLPSLPRAITPGMTLVLDQIRFGRIANVQREEFQSLLARDAEFPPSVRLEGLADVDVILGFIESYGVSALFDERYSAVVEARLDDLGRRVTDAGLHMVSGTLNAPMFGGQSWLAHASLLSGLWIRNQMLYEFLLDTERETLVQDFQRSGHRTVAVMPAITLPWPQGRWFGYDEIFEAGDMGYAGPPFNWVTMPDQFTWWFFEDSVRRSGDRPVFAKLALISSHAPWVPILPILDEWETIGDGAIFRQWEGEGEAPESLWRNHDRVREHFALSVAYALDVAGRYAAAFTDERTLLILLGDHQPAQIITGSNPSPGVPVHVISGDPALLEPFRERGFAAGAWPVSENTETGMDRFREWLHDGYRATPTSP